MGALDTTMQKNAHDQLMSKVYKMMLSLLFIFGIPAGLAFALGSWINNTQDWGVDGFTITLPISFIFSWIVTIALYRKLDKERKAIEAAEHEEQQ